MTIKEKFNSIDQSKLNADQKGFLEKIKTVTKDFTIENKEVNDKVEGALDKMIATFKEKIPDAIKTVEKKEPTKKATTKKAPAKKKESTPSGKRTVMSIAKEIRKEGESWKDAQARARKQMKEDSESATKTMKTELQKLQDYIKEHKELSGMGKTDLLKDASRKALPSGRRVSHKGWKNQYGTSDGGKVYYERRENRRDRLAPKYPQGAPKLANGGDIDAFTLRMVKGNAGSPDEVRTEEREIAFANGGGVGSKLDAGIYRIGKPIKVRTNLYAQKIVEIFDNGDISTASDYGRSLNDFKSQKYPIISKEQFNAQYSFANGGMMDNMSVHDGTSFMNTPVYKRGGDILSNLKNMFTKDVTYKTDEYGNFYVILKPLEEQRKYENMEDEIFFKMPENKLNKEDVGDFFVEQSNVFLSNAQLSAEEIERKFGVKLSNKAKEIYTDKSKSLEKNKLEELIEQYKIALKNKNYENIRKLKEEIDFESKSRKFANGGFMDGVYAKGGYTQEGEDYEYINTFGIPQNDFIKLVQAYHKSASLKQVDRIESRLIFSNMRSKYGEDKIDEIGNYIHETHEKNNSDEYAEGGIFYKEGSNKYGLGNTEIFVIEENDMYSVYDNVWNDENQNWEIKKIAEFETMEEAKEFSIDYSNNQYENGGDFMSGAYAEDGAEMEEETTYIRNKDGIKIMSVAMPEKELSEAEWMAKHNDSSEARTYAVGGGIFADTFTGYTGTHYTGLVGETNAMSSGEMFAEGGGVGEISFEDWLKKNNIDVYKRTYYWVADDGKGDYLYAGTKAEVIKSLKEDWKNYPKEKYIGHSQIENIKVYKGSNVLTYSGKDVLNGVNILYKGGNIKEKAYYIPKREIVEVELKNGKKLKPANGYWIKNDAKQIKSEKFNNGGFMNGVYAESGAMIQNQQLINDATMNTAQMFANEGIPAYVPIYKRGGMLTPSQRYVQEIKGLTGLTQNAIEDYISENKLTNDEVLNIVIGLGRKQIERGDVSTAMIGKKGNAESKKLLAFAKSNKALTYAVGGGIFSDTFTGETGTHYTGLVGETNAMSSGEMFENGGRVYDGVVDYKKASKMLMKYKPEILYYNYGYVFVDGIGLALGSLTNHFRGYGDSTDIKNLVWKVTNAPFDVAKKNIEKLTKGEYTLKEGGYGNEQHFIVSKNYKFVNGGLMDVHNGTSFMDAPIYKRGGALKRDRGYVNHDQDYEMRYSRKHPSRHGYGNIKYHAGGNLHTHGLEEGDEIIKTIGAFQKVKDKKGNIMYVDLKTGYRGKEEPLPFANGGGINKDIEINDSKFERFKNDLIKHSESYKYGDGYNSRFKGLKNKSGDISTGEYLIDGNVILWNYLDKKNNIYTSSEVPEMIIDIRKTGFHFKDRAYYTGGGVDYEYDGIAYAKTKALESIDWDKELREYAGSEYSKLTAREKEQIISDMQRDWNRGHSFANGGGVNKDIEITSRIQNLIDKIKKEGIYEKGKESTNINDVNYRYDYYKLENPNYNLVKEFDSIQFQNHGQFHFSNKFNQSRLDFDKKSLIIDRPTYKGQKPKFLTFQELVILGKRKMSNGGAFERLSNRVAKEYVGDAVAPKYQRLYGKRYDKEEAQEVGDKVAGKVKAMQMRNKKAFGGLFGKSQAVSTPKVNLYDKQVMLNNGEWVQVLDQSGDSLMVLDLGKIGTGAEPKRVSLSDVDMNSFMSGGKVTKKKTTTKKATTNKAKNPNVGQARVKANALAKQIRKEGEAWASALKRAYAEMRLKKQGIK